MKNGFWLLAFSYWLFNRNSKIVTRKLSKSLDSWLLILGHYNFKKQKQMKKILFLLLIVFGLLACNAQKATLIKAENAQDFIKKQPNLVILDVRTAEEFKEGHIKGAINVDVKRADFEDNIAKLDTDKTYLVYCGSGGRSSMAVKTMKNKKFKSLYEISEGFKAWLNNELPVETK